jgi:hypothetical protein
MIPSVALRLHAVAVAALLLLTIVNPGVAGWFVDVESGIAVAGYNDVRIPGDTGTEFSLTDDLSTDAAPFGRFRLGLRPGDRHHVSVFAAPLRLSADGRLPKSVLFQGAEFAQGTDVEGSYRFDSYRLTYRYRVYDSRTFTGWLGFTGKIRDAEISLESAEVEARKKNTGFVPLLAFRLDWRVGERVTAILEGDAVAGGPGRAEDIFLGLGLRTGKKVLLKGGYRILEGGADVDEVYNFALIHFASVGCVVSF